MSKNDGRSKITITVETDSDRLTELEGEIKNILREVLCDRIHCDGYDFGKYKISAKKGATELWTFEAPIDEYQVVIGLRVDATSASEAERIVDELIGNTGSSFDIHESYRY